MSWNPYSYTRYTLLLLKADPNAIVGTSVASTSSVVPTEPHSMTYRWHGAANDRGHVIAVLRARSNATPSRRVRGAPPANYRAPTAGLPSSLTGGRAP